jgi:hypothetical protein
MLYLLLWRLLQLCGLASSPGRQLAFLRSSAQPRLIVLGWPVKYFLVLSLEKKIIFITGRWWGREVLLPNIRPQIFAASEELITILSVSSIF